MRTARCLFASLVRAGLSAREDHGWCSWSIDGYTSRTTLRQITYAREAKAPHPSRTSPRARDVGASVS